MTFVVVGEWPGDRVPIDFGGEFGHPAADIPSGGDDVSPLANDGILPADQYAWQITSLPGSGTLTATDAGAVSITGVSGSTTANYTVYILRGATGTVDTQANTISFADGAGASVAGQTLTAAASLIAGSASGTDGATVAGQVVEAVASLLVGEVDADSSVAGQLLAAAASLLAGSASGTNGIEVNGQTLTATASLLPGSVSGVANATVDGQLLTATVTLVGGGAFGPSSGGAPRNRPIVLSVGVRL